MHLTRPKSSKGRSRPAVNISSYGGDTDRIPRPPASPSPPECGRPDRNLRSQSQPIMWQAGQLSQDEVLQMLHHSPAAPPLCLNKYKVLPSIERRHSEVRGLDKHLSMMSLSDDATLQQGHMSEAPYVPEVMTGAQASSSEDDRRAHRHLRIQPKPPDPEPVLTKEAGATGSLLLAIRAPCGRRFQQHFNPTDTLLMVKASAEVRYGDKYGDASIETMEVPRRTFTDMDMTLAQCGILNRSVLCISQTDSVVEHEGA